MYKFWRIRSKNPLERFMKLTNSLPTIALTCLFLNENNFVSFNIFISLINFIILTPLKNDNLMFSSINLSIGTVAITSIIKEFFS